MGMRVGAGVGPLYWSMPLKMPRTGLGRASGKAASTLITTSIVWTMALCWLMIYYSLFVVFLMVKYTCVAGWLVTRELAKLAGRGGRAGVNHLAAAEDRRQTELTQRAQYNEWMAAEADRGNNDYLAGGDGLTVTPDPAIRSRPSTTSTV